MMCPCGNATSPRKEVSGVASLKYERCGACGRCGQFDLHVGGDVVAQGEPARSLFRDYQAGRIREAA